VVLPRERAVAAKSALAEWEESADLSEEVAPPRWLPQVTRGARARDQGRVDPTDLDKITAGSYTPLSDEVGETSEPSRESRPCWRKFTVTTHLIQFPTEEDYRRAVATLSEVPRTRVGLPDNKMVVTNEHLAALDQGGITYKDLTTDVGSGATTPVRA
jgi:hypothetical protein